MEKFECPSYLDRRQARIDHFHDHFSCFNRYRLDTRFLIRDGKKHKCAILCPGGGYRRIDSYAEGTPIARALNKRGISAIIVYYRVGKRAAFPNPQDDLARAVREIFAKGQKWNLDMSDYSVWGGSSGGHLVGTWGTTAMGYVKYGLPKPGCIVLEYPVISLTREITHQGSRERQLGKDSTRESELKHSVDTNVDAAYPPTYIWCGTTDEVVPPENTERMRQALERNGITHLCEFFEGVPHGLGTAIGTKAEGWIDHAVSFWQGLKK